MSRPYIRKNNTNYPVGNIPIGFPSYLLGYDNTNSGLSATNPQDAIDEVNRKTLKSAEIEITSQSVSANSAVTIGFPTNDWNNRTCISVVLKSGNSINVWLVGQPVHRPNANTKWVITIANLYNQALTLEGSLIVYYI